MAEQLPTLGDVVGGFRIEGELGRGGMGIVYLAFQENLRRKVALKVIASELAGDATYRARFEREARLAAAIDHPNVVPVFEAGSADGQLFLAMRYVEGTDLRTVLARQGPLDVERASRITEQLGAALDAAHAKGLTHRDVKPANVLLAGSKSDFHVYLTDFGLTKEASSKSSGLTQTDQWMGTVDYVAPEQMDGGPVDARTDVYALGCVLFEMLAGRVPYRGTLQQKMFGHATGASPSLAREAPGVANQFDPVVERSMAKDPAGRYPSAGDLGRAAIGAAREEAITEPERSVATGEAAVGMAVAESPANPYAATEPVAGRTPRPGSSATARLTSGDSRRTRRAVLGGLAVLLLLGLGFGGSMLITGGSDPPGSKPSAERSEPARVAPNTQGEADSDPSTRSRTRAKTPTPPESSPTSWPAGGSGYTVILASERQREDAERKARAVGGEGIGVLNSNDFDSLNPGYWVAYAGRHQSKAEAADTLEFFRRQGFTDAYVKFVG